MYIKYGVNDEQNTESAELINILPNDCRPFGIPLPVVSSEQPRSSPYSSYGTLPMVSSKSTPYSGYVDSSLYGNGHTSNMSGVSSLPENPYRVLPSVSNFNSKYS